MSRLRELDGIAERVGAMTASFADLATVVSEEDGHTDISPTAVFPEPFMQAHTAHPTIEAFVEHSPLDTDPGPDDVGVPAEAIDEYIATASAFDSWEDMVEAARVAWLERELGLV